MMLLSSDLSSSYLRSDLLQQDIADSTASASCFDQARSWVSTCLRHHESCGRSTSRGLYQYYPTRLLDLQPQCTDIEICLCIPHRDPPGTPYMTLSHCWGTSRFFKLTRANLKHLEVGFQLVELPRTFREAIYITRELGIRYLWIDALCILQDSQEDWRYEAAMMMKVYENSYCNIAALGAFDSEQGCFFQRDPLLVPRIIVEPNWDNALNMSYDLYSDFFWQYHLGHSPLNRRAWVVQERILAPRVLYYGKEQLLWECVELDACETYPDGLPHADPGRWKGIDLDVEFLSKILALEPERKQSMYEFWHEVVRIYTLCDLTRPEDKLVAISGLAKRVQRCLGDEYIAGLWRESLPSELLWGVGKGDLNKRPSTRSNLYRAPTWSWASIDGWIYYLDADTGAIDRLEDTGFVVRLSQATPASDSSEPSPQMSPCPRHRDERNFEKLDSVITILASGVDLATTDVTGQVTHGFIRLSGSLIPAHIEVMPVYLNGVQVDSDFAVDLPDLQHEDNFFAPDFDIDTRNGRAEIFFLPIMMKGEKEMRGLLLECVDPVKHVYERIGFLSIHDYYNEDDEDRSCNCGLFWKEKFKEQVLTLI